MDFAAAAVTSVADTASSTTLAAANGRRIGLYVFNDSTSDLYLKYGASASTTSFTVKIPSGYFWEMPTTMIYQGLVTGIWASNASGAALITELTV